MLRIRAAWVLSPTQDIDVTPSNTQGTWRKRSWKDSKNWKIRRAAKCHLLSRHSRYNYDHTVALAAALTRSTPVGPSVVSHWPEGSSWNAVAAWWATGNWWILGGEQSRLQACTHRWASQAPTDRSKPILIQTAPVKLSGLQTKKTKCEQWICREGWEVLTRLGGWQKPEYMMHMYEIIKEQI